MHVTAWNNGKHLESGGGYGIKIDIDDRDQFFRREWGTIYVALPGYPEEVELNINKDSFWNETCRELISKKIGKWFIENGHAPWSKGYPPRFKLIPIHDNHFKLLDA